MITKVDTSGVLPGITTAAERLKVVDAMGTALRERHNVIFGQVIGGAAAKAPLAETFKERLPFFIGVAARRVTLSYSTDFAIGRRSAPVVPGNAARTNRAVTNCVCKAQRCAGKFTQILVLAASRTILAHIQPGPAFSFFAARRRLARDFLNFPKESPHGN
jgi:hypothetical protein